jgi:hypothetical protein
VWPLPSDQASVNARLSSSLIIAASRKIRHTVRLGQLRCYRVSSSRSNTKR